MWVISFKLFDTKKCLRFGHHHNNFDSLHLSSEKRSFQLFFQVLFVFLSLAGCSTTKEKILFESQYDQRFPAKNIFRDEKDVKGKNYWLSPHGKEGSEAFFILDLGCEKIVRGFRIKNTHNAFHHDRGTQRFLIFGAGGGEEDGDQEEVEWVQLVNEGLEDPRHEHNIPVKVFHLDKPRSVRFIRFIVVSYFGSGGGLQYFGYF